MNIKSKKIISLLLTMLMITTLLSLFPINAFAKGETKFLIYDNFECMFKNDEVTVVGYKGKDTTVTIPSKLNGYPVVALKNEYGAFGFLNIKSIKIPASVTSLGTNLDTPLDSINLTTIIIDSKNNNFSSVNGVLFNKDKTKLIYYPKAKTDVSYTMPSLVEETYEYSFNNTKKLKKLTISTNLKKFHHLGISATTLTSITAPSENKYFTSAAGVLYNKKKTVLVKYPENKAGSTFKIPSSVKEIADSSFKYNTKLTKMTIPKNVITINDNAFSSVPLKSLEIKNGTKYIGKETFNCASLTSIKLPNSIEYVGSHNFTDSVWYKKQKENSYVYLGKVLLGYTGTLKENSTANIKAGTKAIAGSALVSQPIKKVNIPSSVVSIGDIAFGNNKNMTSLVVPKSVKTIGSAAFSENTALASIKLNNGLINIGHSAFSGNSALKNITIPSTVKVIDDFAFAHCNNLLKIDIPSSVTTIGEYAFFNMEK